MATITAEWNHEDPLARAKGETRSGNSALRDYALLGGGRSLRTLLEIYREQNLNEGISERPPTIHFSTLANWSMSKDWVKRVDAWEELETVRLTHEWTRRRLDIIEADYRQGTALRALV